MKNVKVAFKFIDKGIKLPIRFKKITCHIIFDVKFDLTRKARYVVGDHLAQVPEYMSYFSVVSRELVRIMLLIETLNTMCDIRNTYLNSETRERLCFTDGSGWVYKKGRQVIVNRE